MKRSEQDRMLRGILDDESLARVRRDSLERGLGALRGRRRRRAAFAGAMASLVVAIVVLTLNRREPPIAERAVETPTKVAGVKIISDQELLALFSDRPLALFGPPGEQQLVFLDVPAPSVGAATNR